MHLYRRLLFLLIIILNIIAFKANSQVIAYPDHFSIESSLSVHIIPEEDTLARQQMMGFDINYNRSFAGREDEWIHFLNAKFMNYNLIYLDLNELKGDNNTSRMGFGKQIGLVVGPKIQLFRIGPWYHYLVLGFGMSYVTKSYYDNPQNRFIGSRLNNATRAEYVWSLELNSRINICGGLRFYHFSNGGYQIPNSGINSLGGKIGLQYHFNYARH